MPNWTLFVNPVSVNTANEKRRLEYYPTLPKETDVARMRRMLPGAIDSLPHVLRDPAPDVLLFGFTSKDLTLRLRWWVDPPRHFELQRGLDTVLAKVRQAMLAESAEASAPPQPFEKESR